MGMPAGVSYSFGKDTHYVGVFNPQISNRGGQDRIVLFFDNLDALRKYLNNAADRNPRLTVERLHKANSVRRKELNK